MGEEGEGEGETQWMSHIPVTLSGQPNMEKGRRPDENQVSSTSSSAGHYAGTHGNTCITGPSGEAGGDTLLQDNLVFGSVELFGSFFKCHFL